MKSGKFLLTRPSQDVTDIDLGWLIKAYISTHTPLAGRDIDCRSDCAGCNISTHTPLAGRDYEPEG